MIIDIHDLLSEEPGDTHLFSSLYQSPSAVQHISYLLVL